MKNTDNWFDVDKDGLSKLVADKPKVFILHELLQNAWDQNITHVRMLLVPNGRGKVSISVEDDDPEGFKDLAHAFTLFAESDKKSDPEKRGRFNLGEKLVLACCHSASVITTKGTVEFGPAGRRKTRKKLDQGSIFTARVKMNREEYKQMHDDLKLVIPPCPTFVGSNELRPPKLLAEFKATLPTQISDEGGVLRGTSRKTTVRVYEPKEGHVPHLYEMGIPVVPVDCKWHIEVQQKIPLNMDRDNVTPSYYAKIMAEVVSHMANKMSEEDAASSWANTALEHKDIDDSAVSRMLDLRFGEHRVSYDPSDPEANQTAVSEGYKVVHGGTLSKSAWANVRRASAISSAGSKFTTPKPFSPDGTPLKLISPEDYTKGQKEIADFSQWLASELIGATIHVCLTKDRGWKFNGAYGSRTMYLNLSSLGNSLNSRLYRTILHELAHEYSESHLDKEFYDALNRFAVMVTSLTLKFPDQFEFLMK